MGASLSLPSSITFQMEAQWSGAEATGRPALANVIRHGGGRSRPVLSFFYSTISLLRPEFSKHSPEENISLVIST